MKLNMYADFTFKIPFEERLMLIKNNGFDGVMLGFSEGLMYTQYDIVRSFGLDIENVHSPFDRMNSLWEVTPVSEYILNRTLECIDVCERNGIKKVVIHPTDGMTAPGISKFGLENFARIVDRGEKRGVELLFENIQIPKFLNVIFDNFGSSPYVRFCYDLGHENCFSVGSECLRSFGDRLSGLHVHDNDGKTDGHLVPYDGNSDFDRFLSELKKLDYDGAMSLEVYMGKSSLYESVSSESFVAKAARAGRFLAEKYRMTEAD
ncbi:MAG: sugar phosphate isomerase/epimerase [Ruminococcus sp.]|nr:sugar phosphate isomerase/epimerase [Ruminococcus sp.]